MKASTPPPAEPTPAAVTAPPPAVDPVAAPTPSTTSAAWPGWYPAADFAAVVLVLVAAWLAASFAARNSDVWLHLAGGRLVATGAYPWGGDPFSFASAGRPWVNTSWLYDLGLYAAFKAAPLSGGVPVVLKAVAFAAAFGLPLLLRRPGHALWPWAVCAALGVLASSPSATLRPVVASMLFLSVTLVVLYRGRWAAGGWRMPGVLAGLFAVWANVDQWFVLGPLTVLLVLVGELLHRAILGRTDEPAGGDTLPAAPPVPALARALAVGVAACLLNPTLLAGLAKNPGEAVAQLVPSDLGWGLPAEAADDPEFALYTLTPLSPMYMERYQFGYNLNGLAAAVLLVGGAVALMADFARLRVTHILLWVGFAAVALQQFRLIPFFAVVAAPLAAAHLNGLSTRVRLGSVADQGTRIWLALSGVGRILTVTAAAVMAVAGWPGWLHPQPTDPALARRVEWAIDPDPGPGRAALVVERWRAAGDLPETIRGLAASPDFADYCAWFAPSEKVFVNSRFGFHAAELPDLLALRKGLGAVRSQAGTKPDPALVAEVVRKYEAEYVVPPGLGRGADSNRDAQRGRFLAGLVELLQDTNGWRLWHLDGRSAIVGRATAAGADKVRFDPVRLAFGPDVRPLPKGVVVPAPAAKPDLEWYEAAVQLWDVYTARAKPLPPETDDAAVFDQFGRFQVESSNQQWQSETRSRTQARAAFAGIAAAALGGTEPPPADAAQFAYPMLALRAARRAVAANPDRPESYRVLSGAYESPRLALFQPAAIPVAGPRYAGPDRPPVLDAYPAPGDRPEQVVTALVRAVARLPRPADATPEAAMNGMVWYQQLAGLYFSPPNRQLTQKEFDGYLRGQQLDLAREAVGNAVRYAKVIQQQNPELFRLVVQAGPKVEDLAGAVVKDLEDREAKITDLVVPRNDALERQAADGKAVERFYAAARLGLPGKAIELFKEVKDAKEFGGPEQHLAAAVQLIELELRAGRLEEAVADLDALVEGVGEQKEGENQLAKDAVRYLRFRVARLAGNYEQAGEGWVDLFRDRLPSLPPDARQAAAAFEPGLEAGFGAVGGVPGLIAYDGWASAAFQANQLLQREAVFYRDRAVLALQEGNIKEATARLQQALKPQGLDLAALGAANEAQEIELYLRLIQQAGRGK